jgi:hypothetical protein
MRTSLLLAAAIAGSVHAQAPAPAAADKARVEPYGQAMLDVIHDDGAMHPDWRAAMRPSQVAVNCPADPGCGGSAKWIASVRQSSLGLRAFVPTSIGELKADAAFDLFGVEGGTKVHFIRFWAELNAWGIGLADSNFMNIDAFPAIIDYWGPPGMAFLRNPQLRYTGPAGDRMSWAVSLEAPNSVIDTGKASEIDPALGAGVVAHNRWPDLVASLRVERDWGHVKAAAMLREVGFETSTTPSGAPSGHRTGWGLNVSGAYKLHAAGTLSWGLVGGRAIASYMNDGGTDLAPDARLRAKTVPSLGYFAYYGHSWSEKLTSALGYSQHRQDNTEGQSGSALRTGSYASANLLFSPTKSVLVGGELLWGRRENKDGSRASSRRLQVSTRYSF